MAGMAQISGANSAERLAGVTVCLMLQPVMESEAKSKKSEATRIGTSCLEKTVGILPAFDQICVPLPSLARVAC